MIEQWKPVPSKPGLMASSFGRIKLPDGVAKLPNGGFREYHPKPTYGTKTKASKTARHEYMGVYNRKFGNMKIHRVVCEAFHGPAPFDRAVVIHIDEDATNNKVENLRWGTQKENLNMPKFIEYCKSRTGENSPAKKGKKAKSIFGGERQQFAVAID
jgi:hypothetical protein